MVASNYALLTPTTDANPTHLDAGLAHLDAGLAHLDAGLAHLDAGLIHLDKVNPMLLVVVEVDTNAGTSGDMVQSRRAGK